MKRCYLSILGTAGIIFIMICSVVSVPDIVNADQTIKIFLDGNEVKSDTPPIIINDRTMLPVRAIIEAMGMTVDWDNDKRQVNITSSNITIPVNSNVDLPKINSEMTIMGTSVASGDDLKALLKSVNPDANPELVDLYLNIGSQYGIRGDIAFSQAAKETGWWKFGGLVEPQQNNYCGLSATGRAAMENEDLRGANPDRVWFETGKHGAFFDSPATGVEAHIQHLYAYATDKPLPEGKELLSPRFVLVSRGNSPKWTDLGGKWAVPGYDRTKYQSFAEAFVNAETYGHSILNDYYKKALQIGNTNVAADNGIVARITTLEKENELLKIEIEQLKARVGSQTKI